MIMTKLVGIEYDEDRLTVEEQDELEEFCSYLSNLVDDKISQMGLHIIEGAYNNCITRLTEEELMNAISVEEYNMSKNRRLR